MPFLVGQLLGQVLHFVLQGGHRGGIVRFRRLHLIELVRLGGEQCLCPPQLVRLTVVLFLSLRPGTFGFFQLAVFVSKCGIESGGTLPFGT